MSINKKELIDLRSKIEWKGGLAEYILGYGGSLPKEFNSLVDDLRTAYYSIQTELEKLYDKHNTEI